MPTVGTPATTLLSSSSHPPLPLFSLLPFAFFLPPSHLPSPPSIFYMHTCCVPGTALGPEDTACTVLSRGPAYILMGHPSAPRTGWEAAMAKAMAMVMAEGSFPLWSRLFHRLL